MVLIGENLGKIKITCQFWCFISNNSCQSLAIFFMFSRKNAFCLSIFNLSQFVFHDTMKNDNGIQPNMFVKSGNPTCEFHRQMDNPPAIKAAHLRTGCHSKTLWRWPSLHQNWLSCLFWSVVRKQKPCKALIARGWKGLSKWRERDDKSLNHWPKCSYQNQHEKWVIATEVDSIWTGHLPYLYK